MPATYSARKWFRALHPGKKKKGIRRQPARDVLRIGGFRTSGGPTALRIRVAVLNVVVRSAERNARIAERSETFPPAWQFVEAS